MQDNDFEFLKELVETPSPSGYEQPAQRVIKQQLESVASSINTDVMGNQIAWLKGQGGPKVMLAGLAPRTFLMPISLFFISRMNSLTGSIFILSVHHRKLLVGAG